MFKYKSKTNVKFISGNGNKEIGQVLSGVIKMDYNNHISIVYDIKVDGKLPGEGIYGVLENSIICTTK